MAVVWSTGFKGWWDAVCERVWVWAAAGGGRERGREMGKEGVPHTQQGLPSVVGIWPTLSQLNSTQLIPPWLPLE